MILKSQGLHGQGLVGLTDLMADGPVHIGIAPIQFFLVLFREIAVIMQAADHPVPAQDCQRISTDSDLMKFLKRMR